MNPQALLRRRSHTGVRAFSDTMVVLSKKQGETHRKHRRKGPGYNNAKQYKLLGYDDKEAREQ
jgi:hypothetical protein